MPAHNMLWRNIAKKFCLGSGTVRFGDLDRCFSGIVTIGGLSSCLKLKLFLASVNNLFTIFIPPLLNQLGVLQQLHFTAIGIKRHFGISLSTDLFDFACSTVMIGRAQQYPAHATAGNTGKIT